MTPNKSILFYFWIKTGVKSQDTSMWTHHCCGAQNEKGRPQFSADICPSFIAGPLEWLISLLFIHLTVAKLLYFSFRIAPVHLAVLIWPPPPTCAPPPPLLLDSFPLYLYLFFSIFSPVPLSPSRAPVIIWVPPTGAHFHISPPQKDTTRLLYLSVFIQLIFHTLPSNIAALCSWDNRAEHWQTPPR